MSKSHRSYTAEFKKEAIKLALNSPSVQKAATALGVPEATLHSWVQKAKRSGEEPDPSSGKMVNVGELLAEVKQLKKQLTEERLEKEILKKAATYFAKELG